MRIHRTVAAGIGTLAAAGAFAAATAPADAAVPTTCIQDKRTSANFYCPLSRSRVPVYAQPALGKRVGFLNRGGLANWFRFQREGQRITRNGLTNHWWAYTEADGNGRMGYVPEVYFRGGGAFTTTAARGLPISFDGGGPVRRSGQRP